MRLSTSKTADGGDRIVNLLAWTPIPSCGPFLIASIQMEERQKQRIRN